MFVLFGIAGRHGRGSGGGVVGNCEASHVNERSRDVPIVGYEDGSDDSELVRNPEV